MALPPLVATVLLVAIPFLSVYCLFGHLERAGVHAMIRDLFQGEKHLLLLPNTTAPVKTYFTGITTLDRFFARFGVVFWPALSGDTPELSLFGAQFALQLIPVYLIIAVESLRVGNKWRIVSFTPFWGILIQVVSFAVTTPVFSLVHLFTSPTALLPGTKSPTTPSTTLLTDLAPIVVLPVSITLGYILPSILAALPSPVFTSYETHQVFMALWQIFPLIVSVIQLALTCIYAFIVPEKSSYRSAAARNATILNIFRRNYLFAITISAISHVAVLTLTLAPLFFPFLFAENFLPSLHPAAVFLPPIPWDAPKASSIGEGFHVLLQFDELLGTLAANIWALVLLRNAKLQKGCAISWAEWIGLLLKVLTGAVLVGPGTVAALLVWQRDELILGEKEGVAVATDKKAI